MNRKDFFKKSVLSAFGIAAGSKIGLANTKPENSTYDKLMDQVGFNHLPNKEIKSMKTVLHKSNTRGDANHGWLHSKHSFSFANYYNPERMNFGVLRVLNDDIVAKGRGFSTHPHDNMEIISIPLAGDLEHKDSMGNTTVIRNGDIQVMSAGTGVRHSEYNKNEDQEVKFLQIWLFPNKKDVQPRYDQLSLKLEDRKNKLQQILSPNVDDEGVWIHQNAWFHLGTFDKNTCTSYDLKDMRNGVYAFVINGEFEINKQTLTSRDGLGLWDLESFEIEARSSNSEILLMEVPMNI
jgi:redox-sensitive bicupin YhaK (pirin superfamily)